MLTRVLNGVCTIAGAAGVAQFPAFYRQYLQQISGRLAQAAEDLGPVIADARARGLSVPDYLARAAREGGDLTGTLVAGYRATWSSFQRLEQSYAALSQAAVVERPLAFLRYLQPEVAARTLRDFAPALPLTAEGLAYAAAGGLLGVLVAWALEAAGRRLGRRLRRTGGDDRKGRHA